MPQKHLRKKLFIDRNVQGALLMRAARYWLFSIAVVGMLTIVGWVFFMPGLATLVESPEKLRSLLTVLVMAVVVSTLLLPVALYDLICFTHRFAGPMIRLRNSMRLAAEGQAVEPIRFRDEDFWQEYADAFNAMQARLAHYQAACEAVGEAREEEANPPMEALVGGNYSDGVVSAPRVGA